jgi:hypothetical protein
VVVPAALITSVLLLLWVVVVVDGHEGYTIPVPSLHSVFFFVLHSFSVVSLFVLLLRV